MPKLMTVILALLLLTSPASATTVSFDVVNPANVGPVLSNQDVDFFSSSLNGTVLAGQGLSLDLLLGGGVLARLALNNPTALGISLIVFTNAASFPGNAGTTTGSLLDASGQQIGSTQVAGRSQGSDGTFSMGLVSFTASDFAGAPAIDLSGAHLDTAFANTGFAVTGLLLRFSLHDNSAQFGTAQQLPEPSTLAFFLIGGLAAVSVALCRRALG